MKWTDLQVGDILEFTAEYLFFFKTCGNSIEQRVNAKLEIRKIFYGIECINILCNSDDIGTVNLYLSYNGNHPNYNNSPQMFNIVSLKEN